MVTIQELNDKYKPTNEHWDFAGLEPWLVKKGIEQDVINTTLKQTLIDFSPNTLPETNFIFDNTVYLRCLVTKEKFRKDRQINLEKEAHGLVGKSKLQKIWMVIKGKI
jgi:hypothetical protein